MGCGASLAPGQERYRLQSEATLEEASSGHRDAARGASTRSSTSLAWKKQEENRQAQAVLLDKMRARQAQPHRAFRLDVGEPTQNSLWKSSAGKPSKHAASSAHRVKRVDYDDEDHLPRSISKGSSTQAPSVSGNDETFSATSSPVLRFEPDWDGCSSFGTPPDWERGTKSAGTDDLRGRSRTLTRSSSSNRLQKSVRKQGSTLSLPEAKARSLSPKLPESRSPLMPRSRMSRKTDRLQ
eukprot:TRINITY_DN28086_c0_g2_i1.p1 TRINITY_DN28086_c0_g2~~TRINITY_DN28086_c0_g2_i1.p1  ORF type:complete len:239 (-),score=39.44 TRINITY_DN28086_c0_g2_i1:353-1069(-)